MTSLTDKWKQGKLPEAWYYVKDIHNEKRLDRYFKETDNFEYLEDWEVGEVLAEVQSYEEHMILVSYKEELTKACKMRDEVIKKYEDIDDWWRRENQKLKDLLSRCVDELAEFNNSCYPKTQKLLTQIDEVLK